MLFWRNLCQKTSNLRIWTPFLGILGWRTTLVDSSLESTWSTFCSP